MRIGDDDEFGAGRDRRADLLDVRLPALLLVQLERPDLRAEVLREPRGLHVVRRHHGDLVAGFDQPPARQEVGFRAARGDQYLIRRRAGIQRRDPLTQQVRAVRLRVAEAHLEQRQCGGAGEAEQLLDRERMHAGFREVEAHPVFPGALPAFEVEGDEAWSHRS